MQKQQLVVGMPPLQIPSTQPICEACMRGKQHRRSYTAVGKRASELLGIVHSDLCGKMSKPSRSGALYFISFIDDKSRHTNVFFLKHKSDAFKAFQDYKAQAEAQCEKKIRILRTDGGGEFVNNEFNNFCTNEGILRQVTTRYTPQLNGVAERKNRTIVEAARSLLAATNLDQIFWQEAVATAVYIGNRLPTVALNKSTPFEMWCGEKPNLSNLHVFGCVCYVHIPKEIRTKFEDKSIRCMFIGYSMTSYGYKCLDSKTNKVVVSSDVVFEDHAMFNSENCNKSQPVFIEEDRLVPNPVQLGGEPQEIPVHVSETPAVVEEQHLEDAGIEHIREEQHEVAESSVPRTRKPSRKVIENAQACTIEHCLLTLEEEPKTIEDALSSPEAAQWKAAADSEMHSMELNKVWVLVNLPLGRNVVESKWIFKKKYDADNKLERFKARIVARGFTQVYGVDYEETFSPVVHMDSLRTMLAIAAEEDLEIHHMDVDTAFLNGDLHEEVFMSQPPGFIDPKHPRKVCLLKKAVPGLKQSAKEWNTKFCKTMHELGFIESSVVTSVYILNHTNLLVILLYVDDLLIFGKDKKQVKEIKEALKERFRMKDLGEAKFFLGIKIHRDREKGLLHISQGKYVRKMLNTFNMADCKPSHIPMETNLKLFEEESNDQHDKYANIPYRQIIGSLMYLMACTRPDICYSVITLSQFNNSFSEKHWILAKRVLRYLKSTQDFGILYSKGNQSILTMFVDASFGMNKDYRSTTGCCYLLNGGAIAWTSKCQSCIAVSSAEAEYMSLSFGCRLMTKFKRLLDEVGSTQHDPIAVYIDNQSAMRMVESPNFKGRTVHIAVHYHFTRELKEKGAIKLEFVPSAENLADIFTKALAREKFCKHRSSMGIEPP